MKMLKKLAFTIIIVILCTSLASCGLLFRYIYSDNDENPFDESDMYIIIQGDETSRNIIINPSI